jgi:hypothetical protein
MKAVIAVLGSVLLAGQLLAVDPPENRGTNAAPDELTVREVPDWRNLSRGVRFQDLHVGDGKKPSLWAAVYVHYRLTAENGAVLEDTFVSHDRRAAKHVIGAGTMPEVLEMAVNSMRERGRRVLLIPADLLNPMDFHVHDDEAEHDHEKEMEELHAALRPGSMVRAELSLMWVREYDPSNFNRFR